MVTKCVYTSNMNTNSPRLSYSKIWPSLHYVYHTCTYKTHTYIQHVYHICTFKTHTYLQHVDSIYTTGKASVKSSVCRIHQLQKFGVPVMYTPWDVMHVYIKHIHVYTMWYICLRYHMCIYKTYIYIYGNYE